MRRQGKGNRLTNLGEAPATIGFRLDEGNRMLLAERAAGLRVSPHELARQYVAEMLQANEERVLLRRSISSLHELMCKLREELATTAEALLIQAGGVDAKKARAWVEKLFQ